MKKIDEVRGYERPEVEEIDLALSTSILDAGSFGVGGEQPDNDD